MYGDADHDGVDDICEYLVAQAFGPSLYFSQTEGQGSRQSESVTPYLCLSPPQSERSSNESHKKLTDEGRSEILGCGVTIQDGERTARI